MNFFSFLLKQAKGKSEDKTRPRNDFWPHCGSQGVTDQTQQADQKRLTDLSETLTEKHKKSFKE
jgi:hypothetical protein